MTRAQGIRSSKRKLVKSSQDTIPEYCKENSPSILSQNSRRAAQAKKKFDDCKENSPSNLGQNSRRAAQAKKNLNDCKENTTSILSQNSKRAAQAKKNLDDCKENTPSILSQNSRRAAQARKNLDNCKENTTSILSQNSRRAAQARKNLDDCKENTTSILSQNSRRAAQAKINVDDCKENTTSILSQNSRRAAQAKINVDDCKENTPSILSQNSRRAAQAEKESDDCKENISPVFLSSSSKLTPIPTNEEVYSPLRKSRRRPNATVSIKTNKTQSERTVLNDTTNSLKPGLSRNNIFHKIITVPQPSTSFNNNNTDHEHHIPVYNTACPLKTPNIVELIPEKKEAVYEFEVDENEEPLPKKKRKKRAYVRKPKTGPKALTINNIKYSSTESLASLPDKPIRKKNNTFVKPKCNIKPCSSVATLDGSCVSVPSFMSHPNLPLRENICELSVLQETQSEQCATLDSTLLEAPASQSPSSSAVPLTLSHSHRSHFSPNPRCYGSKSGQTPNPYNDDQNVINGFLSQQASSSATNVSSSSHDFLSSTPCKRFSLVVRDNSVFDDSPGMRQSPGLVQDTSLSMIEDDNCFGFDEPEELEEPLVSPIKNGIDLQPMRILKYVPRRNDWEEPKPSIQEVIELLKANIPKPAAKKDTTMFETSTHSSEPTSPTVLETDSPVFVKPARRSYERQRRVQYYNSESEEEEEHVEETKNDTITTKEDKKCYKKANTTKTVKAPKVTKAKQRIAKEEEELEQMAALMNAQFQEIDKVNLVVE